MGEIDRADQKASLLIGSLGIAFSIVLSGMLGGDWTPDTRSTLGRRAVVVGGHRGESPRWSRRAMAVWPRLSKGPGRRRDHATGVRCADSRSPAGVADALAQRGLQPPERTYQQLLVLSAVVQRKYRCIRWSMVLAGVAGRRHRRLAFFVSRRPRQDFCGDRRVFLKRER